MPHDKHDTGYKNIFSKNSNMEKNIRNILENGENSFVEFKEVSVSPHTIAEEIVAFSNVRGGIFL